MQFLDKAQFKIKSTSSSMALWIFKTLTGMFYGFVLSLVGRELADYGPLAFYFVIISVTGIFIKISKGWGFFGVCVFNFVCVLMGLLLKMYVSVGPDW